MSKPRQSPRRRRSRPAHSEPPRNQASGRVDLGGRPPRSPTDPGVHVKCTRFVTLWNRCPSHDWVVSR